MFKKFYVATCLVSTVVSCGEVIHVGPVVPFCDRCWEKIMDPDGEDFCFPSYCENIMDVVFSEPPVCELCGAEICNEVLVDPLELGSVSAGLEGEKVREEFPASGLEWRKTREQ